MEPTSLWLWAGFNLFVLGMLAVDLGIFHRQAHAVSMREAGTWSAVWIALALIFNLGVWKFLGPQPGVEFLTGYLIENGDSLDMKAKARAKTRRPRTEKMAAASRCFRTASLMPTCLRDIR